MSDCWRLARRGRVAAAWWWWRLQRRLVQPLVSFEPDSQAELDALGVSERLEKPFSLEVLAETVARGLGPRQAR